MEVILSSTAEYIVLDQIQTASNYASALSTSRADCPLHTSASLALDQPSSLSADPPTHELCRASAPRSAQPMWDSPHSRGACRHRQPPGTQSASRTRQCVRVSQSMHQVGVGYPEATERYSVRHTTSDQLVGFCGRDVAVEEQDPVRG